jgi:hypothetical protein
MVREGKTDMSEPVVLHRLFPKSYASGEEVKHWRKEGDWRT